MYLKHVHLHGYKWLYSTVPLWIAGFKHKKFSKNAHNWQVDHLHKKTLSNLGLLVSNLSYPIVSEVFSFHHRRARCVHFKDIKSSHWHWSKVFRLTIYQNLWERKLEFPWHKKQSLRFSMLAGVKKEQMWDIVWVKTRCWFFRTHKRLSSVFGPWIS